MMKKRFQRRLKRKGDERKGDEKKGEKKGKYARWFESESRKKTNSNGCEERTKEKSRLGKGYRG